MPATIGSLLVNLQANTAKLDQQLKQSKSHFKSLHGTINTVRNALVAFGAVTAIKDVLHEVAANERAFALLKSQVRATGGAAGYTAGQLESMAMAMEHGTTFSHVAIESAQAELLAFTNITGEQFKKTLQVSMDFATVTGRNLPDALRTLGEAINNPVGALGRLTQAGVSLTKEQTTQIKEMASNGHMMEAQNALLKDLQTSYGGAAAAAKNTLGGAFSSLKNTLSDLIEGGHGSFNGAIRSINELSATLSSQQVQHGFSVLISALASVVSWTAKAVSGFIEMGQGLGILMAKVAGYGGQQAAGLASLDAEIKNIRRDMADLQEQMNLPANQTGLMQNILQKKIDHDKQILAHYLASRKAMLSGKGGEILMPTHSSAAGAHTLIPTTLVTDVAASVKQVHHAAKKISDTIKATHLHIGIPLKPLAPPAQPKELQQLQQFGIQAARNMQSAFAQFLFDPFKHGVRGMVLGFVQSIQQMLAQAMSAKLMSALFSGSSGKGGQSGASFFGSFFTSMFAGGKAAGGSVSPSNAYLVGENGPELFRPNTAGAIIPNHVLGGAGGNNMSTTVNIDARGAGPDETARILAYGRQLQASMQAMVENRLQRGIWTA